MERKKILTSKMILDLRKRIVKCLVWSVALYASETWTISKTAVKRIEAFEMWIWRKMEKYCELLSILQPSGHNGGWK